LVASSLPSVPRTLGRSRPHRPGSPGRLNCPGWEASGHLQRLASGRRTRRCPGLQPQVRKDLLDHRVLQERRNDVRSSLQFGQCSRSRSTTCLSSLAHPINGVIPNRPSSSARNWPVLPVRGQARERSLIIHRIEGLVSTTIGLPPARPSQIRHPTAEAINRRAVVGSTRCSGVIGRCVVLGLSACATRSPARAVARSVVPTDGRNDPTRQSRRPSPRRARLASREMHRSVHRSSPPGHRRVGWS
jgi:hypothetical protein